MGITGEGNWGIVQPGVPAPYTGTASDIQGLLQATLAVLDVLLATLQVVKAFSTGTLNPMNALVEALVAELEGKLDNLRQLGVYVAGDTALEGPSFSALLGGYTAYERRMVGRLTDREDPTRPNFTNQSATLAVFLYASADTSGIGTLTNTLQRLLAFFGQDVPVRTYTVPTGLQANYGVTATRFGSLTEATRAGDVPRYASVKWRMAPPARDTKVRWPDLGPKGFLVEVSTVQDGLVLAYDTYTQGAGAGANAEVRVRGLMRDPKTGTPFRLYGGVGLVDAGDLTNSTFKAVADGTDRETRLYAYRSSADNTPIPLGSLQVGDKHLLQRTFFVEAGFLKTTSPGQGFAAIFSGEDMPWDAHFTVGSDGVVTGTPVGSCPASTVYVRVSAVTEAIADVVVTTNGVGVTGPLAQSLYLWTTSSTDVVGQAQTNGNVVFGTGVFNADAKTEASAPLTLTFPDNSPSLFLDTLTSALVVLVLGRADLPVADSGSSFAPGKALSSTGLEEISRHLLSSLGLSKNYFRRKGVSPEDFRADVLWRCRKLAGEIYARVSPLGTLETTLVDVGAVLRDFTWKSADSRLPALTILDSLQDSNINSGLAVNPFSLGLGHEKNEAIYRGSLSILIVRGPGFMEKTPSAQGWWMVDQGSEDWSPVMYSGTIAGSSISFCRNLIPVAVYQAAASVLNVASAPMTVSEGNGGWKAMRLFPQGVPPVEKALGAALQWAKSLSAGLKGQTEVLSAYIDFLQARILEMQALVVRINALLDTMVAVPLPAVAGLVVTGNGTEGILSALVAAGNKPSDGVLNPIGPYGVYGGGVVILAGGLPRSILEILALFFPRST